MYYFFTGRPLPIFTTYKLTQMLKYINMPVVVKALCGATIGFLIGLYISTSFMDGRINLLVLLFSAVGTGIGIWLLRR